MLSKADMLQPRSRRIVEVDVPEWGGVVRVQELTTSERSKFETSLQGKKGKSDPSRTVTVRERLIVLSVVDEQGQRVFSDEDIPALSEQPIKAIERIFNTIQDVSGFSNDDVADLEKN